MNFFLYDREFKVVLSKLAATFLYSFTKLRKAELLQIGFTMQLHLRAVTMILVLNQVLLTHAILRFIRRTKRDKLQRLRKNTIILKNHTASGYLRTTGHVADILASCSKVPFLPS